ncbi:MAG: serine/threonine-protein kinase [Pseudomonadota bacterium]
MSEAAPSTFGKYRILERIATGGMAEIFKARLDGIGGFHRTFAIKRVLPTLSQNPEFVDLLVDEAKVAGLLSHANIVQILDLGRIDDHYFIAMEYVAGHDLGEVMKRCLEKGITLPVPHAVFICIEVLKGLEYAHKRQVMRDGRPMPLDIIHRDISPSNILVSSQGEVKVTDFGMARASVKALETIAGIPKGRFDYLDPIQSEGRPATQQSDLFSLGIVFYEMLVGDHPFRRDTDMATIDAIRSGQFEPPSFVNMDIPPQLDDVIARALARDPAERYPDATAFKEDLDRFFHESEFIFTQSTLAAFLKGLFPDHKAARAEPRRDHAPTRPLDRNRVNLPPMDDFDEDILPTVVQENPLAQVSPFSPQEPPPAPPPRSGVSRPSAASIHEAATMLRRIPDAAGASAFSQPAGLSDAATLIRANPLLDGELGEVETQIKRRPTLDGLPIPDAPPSDPEFVGFGAAPPEITEPPPAWPAEDDPFQPPDRPTLARADLERPTVASGGKDPFGPPPWAPPPAPAAPPPRPPQPAAPAPPIPIAPPRPSGPAPASYAPPPTPYAPPPAPAPMPAQALSAPQVAPPPTRTAAQAPARIPLKTHLAYLTGALFTLILGLLVGAAAGWFGASNLTPTPTPAEPSGPAELTFRIPSGASLEVDGQVRGTGPALSLQLDTGSAHQVRLLLPGHEALDLPIALEPGEHRTVVVAIAEPDPQ